MLKDNMFYMVAPFLGPLKRWIKQQRKEDRVNGHHRHHLSAAAADTDGDLVETDYETAGHLDEQTADEAYLQTAHYGQTANQDMGHLLAQLQASQAQRSDSQQASHVQVPVVDPATELKRLLSVGAAPMGPSQANESSIAPPTNPLLAILQGGVPAAAPVTSGAMPSRSSLEQTFVGAPDLGDSTHQRAQKHVPWQQGSFSQQPLQFEEVRQQQQPTQLFQRQTNGRVVYQGLQTLGQPYRGGAPVGVQDPNSLRRHEHQQYQQHQQSPVRSPAFQAAQAPQAARPYFPSSSTAMPQQYSHSQRQPYQQNEDDLFNPSGSAFPGVHNKAVPEASTLPQPKQLSAQKMTLLNAFTGKGMAKPHEGKIEAQRQSHLAAEIYRKNSASTASGAPANVQQQAAAAAPSKPQTARQQSLLDLFNSPPPTAPLHVLSQQQAEVPPVELSAQPPPANVSAVASHSEGRRPSIPAQLAILQGIQPKLARKQAQPERSSGLTSATVSGPLNNPDFATVKKITKGTQQRSPHHEAVPNTPVQILQRPASRPLSRTESPAPAKSTVSAKTPLEQPKPFTPHTILRRPQQSETASPAPPAAAATEKKMDLLSLFTQSEAPKSSPTVTNKPAASPPKPDLFSLFTANKSVSPQTATQIAAPNAPAPAPAPSQPAANAQQPPLPQKTDLLALFTQKKPVMSPPIISAGTHASGVPVTGPSSAPLPVSAIERPESLPSDQRNALLSLFSNPPSAVPPSSRKPSMGTGLVSPVSPLPEKQVLHSANHDIQADNRSRMSSIASLLGNDSQQALSPGAGAPELAPSMRGGMTQPTAPGVRLGTQDASRTERKGSSGGPQTPVTPVNRDFLMGYLKGISK